MYIRSISALMFFLFVFAISARFAEAQSIECPVITKYLTVGTRDAQVIVLKKYLTNEKLLVGTQVTNYFGPATEKALQAWQKKKGLVAVGAPATTGFGATGPKTRLLLKNCASTPLLIKNTPAKNIQVDISTVMKPLPQQLTGGSGTPTAFASCMFAGKKINHGSSINTYETAEVPYATVCNAQVRVCTDGVLSGTFTNTACRMLPIKECIVGGLKLSNGSSATFFLDSVAPPGELCKGEERVCTKGVLSGTYTNTECRFEVPKGVTQ